MHERINWSQMVRQVLRRGFNTKTLGDAVGLSQPTISRLSTGKSTSIGADAAVRLIEVAGGSVKLPEITPEPDAKVEAQH